MVCECLLATNFSSQVLELLQPAIQMLMVRSWGTMCVSDGAIYRGSWGTMCVSDGAIYRGSWGTMCVSDSAIYRVLCVSVTVWFNHDYALGLYCRENCRSCQ